MVRGGDKEGVDLLVDPNIAAAEAATAQSCASGNCKAVPATHNLQIRVCISYAFLMYFICISYVFICISYVFFIPYFSYRIFHIVSFIPYFSFRIFLTIFFILYFSYFIFHTVFFIPYFSYRISHTVFFIPYFVYTVFLFIPYFYTVFRIPYFSYRIFHMYFICISYINFLLSKVFGV